MQHRAIRTDRAPNPVGPYNQAIRFGQLVYTAGQIGLDPATGKLVADDVAAQTRQTLGNLAAILAAAGSSMGQVLKTTVLVADMADFPTVNRVYGEFFPELPPARTTVQAAGLPLGAKVEIEVVAYVTEG